MENVGARIKAFREAHGLTQKEVFQATKGEIKQTSLSAIENNQAKPGFDTIAALLSAYPALSSDWMLLGTGPMLRDGRALVPIPRALTPAGPPDDPTPTPPAAPAAAAGLPFSGEVLDRLLSQINTQAQQHREELMLLKKEHKAALNVQARQAQYHMDAMTNKVHYMEGRLGLRPLTPAETAQAALEAPKAKKIGLKHYDESAPTARCVPFYPQRLAA